MTNGPPPVAPVTPVAPVAPDAPPLWQMWRDLAEAQARTSQSVALRGVRRSAFGVWTWPR